MLSFEKIICRLKSPDKSIVNLCKVILRNQFYDNSISDFDKDEYAEYLLKECRNIEYLNNNQDVILPIVRLIKEFYPQKKLNNK